MKKPDGSRVEIEDFLAAECPQVDVAKANHHGHHSMPDALDCTEAIFEPSNLSKHSDYYLQTFIYSCIVRTSSVLNPQQMPVAPALLFIQHAGADDYNPIMKLGDEPVNDIESERQLFGQLLIEKVDSMFNPSLPFEPTSDRRRCTFCPYRLLCASEK